jgi:hypothetical protein
MLMIFTPVTISGIDGIRTVFKETAKTPQSSVKSSRDQPVRRGGRHMTGRLAFGTVSAITDRRVARASSRPETGPVASERNSPRA